MAVYMTRQAPKKPKTRGGLSIIGSILSTIGMATGQPWLAIPGAAMTMIDTPKGQRNPVQFMSTLANVISTTKTAQLAKSDKAYIDQLIKNPDDYEAITMNLPIGLDRRPLGGRGGPPVPSTYSIPEQKKTGMFGLFRGGVGPIQEKMQLSIIEQKIKPEEYGTPPWYTDPKFSETIEGQIASGELPRAEIPKKPEKPKRLTPTDIENSIYRFSRLKKKEHKDDPDEISYPLTIKDKIKVGKRVMTDLGVKYLDEEDKNRVINQIANQLKIHSYRLKPKEPRAPTGIPWIDPWIDSKKGEKPLKKLDAETLTRKLQEFGGDVERVRAWAAENGYVIPK